MEPIKILHNQEWFSFHKTPNGTHVVNEPGEIILVLPPNFPEDCYPTALQIRDAAYRMGYDHGRLYARIEAQRVADKAKDLYPKATSK